MNSAMDPSRDPCEDADLSVKPPEFARKRLQNICMMLQDFHSRNVNQHSRSIWYKHMLQLKRYVNIVATIASEDECPDPLFAVVFKGTAQYSPDYSIEKWHL